MTTTIRRGISPLLLVVGSFVILIGLGAMVTAIILSIMMETAWFLVLFIPALMAFAGGALILRLSRRARLQIDHQGFLWCGGVGPVHFLRWEQLHRLLPPPAGRPRSVAIAQLRDGRQVEVEALWDSPPFPLSLIAGTDHSTAQNALLNAHRAWLAERR